MSRKNCSDFLSRFLLVSGLCLILSGNLFAQNPAVLSTVSPYSRFGVGDFLWNSGIQNTGMGGGGIGLRNDSLLPQYLNLLNPASLTSHPLVTYEMSLFSNTVQLQDANSKTIFNRTTLGHFGMAFPVTKWWGAGFGLVPYSQVGYNLSTSDSLDNIGPVTYKYEGSGGVNQLYFANGFRPFAYSPRHYLLSDEYKRSAMARDTVTIKKKLRVRNNLANISVGINASYLFGSLTNVRRDIFPDSMNTFNTKITKRTTFRDFYITYGIQYTFRLPKSLNPFYVSLPDSMVLSTKWFQNKFYYRQKTDVDTAKIWVKKPGIRVTMGLIGAPPTEINISYDLLGQTYKQFGTIDQIRDTVVSESGIPGRLLLPAMGGFGFALKKDYKWTFQADYMIQLWSKMEYLGQKEDLKNSQRFTAGFQLQPKQSGRGSFFTVSQYRLGVRYYQTYLELHNTQLTEMAVNFSMSIPTPYKMHIGEPVGRTTLSLEYGVRGTTSNNLIREDFFRVTVGFSINDRWFSHYKYE